MPFLCILNNLWKVFLGIISLETELKYLGFRDTMRMETKETDLGFRREIPNVKIEQMQGLRRCEDRTG